MRQKPTVNHNCIKLRSRSFPVPSGFHAFFTRCGERPHRLVLTSCATTKTEKPSAKTAFAASADNPAGKPLSAGDRVPMEPATWFKPNRPRDALAGRTLDVASIRDLKLGPKEVALTFDDGPVPGRTERILDTLARYDVQATFLMVGKWPRPIRPSPARSPTQAMPSAAIHGAMPISTS